MSFRSAPVPVAPQVINAFCLRIVDHARAAGWRMQSMRRSRSKISNSYYIYFCDLRGQLWHFRISDHHRPNRTIADKPHCDIISRDGLAGFDEAVGFIARINSGEITHWDVSGTGARRPASERRTKRCPPR